MEGCFLFLFLLMWLGCFLVCGGWLYPALTFSFSRGDDGLDREALGFATLLGGGFALLGPLGILIVLCMTGFAQKGWSLPYGRLLEPLWARIRARRGK